MQEFKNINIIVKISKIDFKSEYLFIGINILSLNFAFGGEYNCKNKGSKITIFCIIYCKLLN